MSLGNVGYNEKWDGCAERVKGGLDPVLIKISCQRHTSFDQKCVIKYLDFRWDWFHEIMHILHNIHIRNYAASKLE
jgi:hypothetical protein